MVEPVDSLREEVSDFPELEALEDFLVLEASVDFPE